MASARTPLMAGNWKMNLNHFEAIAHVQKIAYALNDKDYAAVEVAVLAPFTDLRSIQTLVDGDKFKIRYGAQDVSAHESGAYTGEISAAMLAKLKCSYVVVGHSERREYHEETDAVVAQKAAIALKHGIAPIICIGEKLQVRSEGNHVTHCLEQLAGSLVGLNAEQVRKSVLAYEPVWAIGTGGSVKGANAAGIMAEKDIDGALIGGASLDPDDFVRIVRYRDAEVKA
jgi:triosephosphate isomerase